MLRWSSLHHLIGDSRLCTIYYEVRAGSAGVRGIDSVSLLANAVDHFYIKRY
jgi:hypothetical protein